MSSTEGLLARHLYQPYGWAARLADVVSSPPLFTDLLRYLGHFLEINMRISPIRPANKASLAAIRNLPVASVAHALG